ncbi:MAG: metallophosphoesterase [Propionibacteriaceae bacterium]|nr:metallophosphoesterase [Propionibacteriaceae bacterium]
MLIAGLGDVHGHWREALALVDAACAKAGLAATDLGAIFQVGDAEAQRTQAEADQVPGPAKYRKLGGFHEVVDGEVVFPAPVFFIAGNHEPFPALDADGGCATGAGEWGPSVTYLGRAGGAEIEGLRLAFLSGIYGERTFREVGEGKPRPITGKRAGHYIPGEVEKVSGALVRGADVLLTHDWPTGIADVGHFGPTGDERIRMLIEEGQPLLSLHGHMHCAASTVIGATQVECLAIVGYHSGDPLAAVGVWDIDPVGRTVRRLA